MGSRARWCHCRVYRYNGGVIIGTTSVAQVEDCVNAFKLEPLPAALNDAVDAIHERYRNPTAAYADKDVVMKAPWLLRAEGAKEGSDAEKECSSSSSS